MKKVAFLVIPGLIGFVVILGLNFSDATRTNHGIEIPIGWHEPEPIDTSTILCFPGPMSGTPLYYERDAGPCQVATNNLAKLLNYLLGIAYGAMVGLIIRKKLG